jgi:hypothetical protein
VYDRAAADMITGFDWSHLDQQAAAATRPRRPRQARSDDQRAAPPLPYGRLRP